MHQSRVRVQTRGPDHSCDESWHSGTSLAVDQIEIGERRNETTRAVTMRVRSYSVNVRARAPVGSGRALSREAVGIVRSDNSP